MARVVLRPLAEVDILEIWDFIAEDGLVEADHWIDRLDEKLKLWATQPMMGRARDELAFGLRSFVFGRYVAFFTPLQDGIELVRILHCSRDLDEHF